MIKVNHTNYEELLIKKLEGQLNTEENAAVNLFMYNHPELKMEWDMLEKTILTPDETIVFANKSSLKKPEPVTQIVPLYRSLMVAASVAAAVLVIAYVLFFQNNPVTVAANNPIKTKVNSDVNNPVAAIQSISSTENKADKETMPAAAVFSAVSKRDNKGNNNTITRSPVNAKPATAQQPQPVNDGRVKIEQASLASLPLKAVPIKEHPFYAAYILNSNGYTTAQQPMVSEGNSWLMVASVVGAELYRLSGRGELFPNKPDINKNINAIKATLKTKKIASLFKKHNAN